MVKSKTLLIKRFPNTINEKEKRSFFEYFGAKEIKFISTKKNKCNILANFETECIAENVLLRLHQVSFFGCALCVEYVNDEQMTSFLYKQSQDCFTYEDKENKQLYKQFLDKLSSWHEGVNFKLPIPSHLKYQYPPPNEQTLYNIIKVLATVPKFYTQVIHLMNKMNLPCPFGKDILPDFVYNIPCLNVKPVFENSGENTENLCEKVTTSESEISSDEDIKQHIEKNLEKKKNKKKVKVNVSKYLKPAPVSLPKAKKTLYEDVFEKPIEEREPKKIKLSSIKPVSNPSNYVPKKADDCESAAIGFGFIHPPNKKECLTEAKVDLRNEREEERLEKEEIECISKEELSSNQILEKDRLLLPVFKNYAEGAPTCRLYIKNLSKNVSESDLKYIYNRYLISSNEDHPNVFDIRLMQEGRMKGQAFVTLQSVELAQKALKETNGFILKDKPLVVQFARSATK